VLKKTAENTTLATRWAAIRLSGALRAPPHGERRGQRGHPEDLSGTQVADLGPLKGLTALQTLDLSRTQVADLGPVQDLPNLKAISSGAPDAEKQRFDAYRAQKGLRIVSDTVP